MHFLRFSPFMWNRRSRSNASTSAFLLCVLHSVLDVCAAITCFVSLPLLASHQPLSDFERVLRPHSTQKLLRQSNLLKRKFEPFDLRLPASTALKPCHHLHSHHAADLKGHFISVRAPERFDKSLASLFVSRSIRPSASCLSSLVSASKSCSTTQIAHLANFERANGAFAASPSSYFPSKGFCRKSNARCLQSQALDLFSRLSLAHCSFASVSQTLACDLLSRPGLAFLRVPSASLGLLRNITQLNRPVLALKSVYAPQSQHLCMFNASNLGAFLPTLPSTISP